jgi:hypothetical protein
MIGIGQTAKNTGGARRKAAAEQTPPKARVINDMTPMQDAEKTGRQSQPSAFQKPPPRQLVYWQKALIWQSLGFLIVAVLTWSDAIFDLAHVILGLPHRDTDINRAAITTAVLLLLWMFSAYKIYLVVSRLSYLESFLHVCAWCRKIEHNNRWLSLEAHFTQQTGGKVSHGICPQCSQKVMRQAQGDSAAEGS